MLLLKKLKANNHPSTDEIKARDGNISRLFYYFKPKLSPKNRLMYLTTVTR